MSNLVSGELEISRQNALNFVKLLRNRANFASLCLVRVGSLKRVLGVTISLSSRRIVILEFYVDKVACDQLVYDKMW